MRDALRIPDDIRPKANVLRRCLAPLSLAVLALAGPAFAAPSLDVLIRNGTVIDGSGRPGFVGAVGILGDRIVYVGGPTRRSAKQVIDAKGLVVAPGFIDPHNHVLESVARMKGPVLDEQYLTQGVTSVIVGPDGDLSPSQIRQVNGELARRGSGTNYLCYVGHNGIRSEVMGPAHRAPTASELDKMKALVREGMQMGCVGLSTGLMYEPGMFSDTSEVIALAREVKPFDGSYDSHTRDPGWRLFQSEKEAIDIGKAAGIPVKLAHEKATGLVNRGKIGDIINLVETARAAGQDVVADQYPYDGASTRVLRNLLIFEGMAADGEENATLVEAQQKLRAVMGDPGRREVLKHLSEYGVDGGFSWIKAVGYGNMRIVDAPDDPSLMDQNLALLARQRGKDPFDLIADLVLSSHRDIMVTLGSVDEVDLQQLIVRPWVMISSDGAYLPPGQASGHPRSTGSFTRVLGRYSRDLKLLPLEEAVRKMTSMPAEHLRMYDRGRLAVGYAADVTVFDPLTVRDRSTYTDPSRLSDGIVDVLVNGRLAVRDGKVTGAANGRFLVRQTRPAGRSGPQRP